MKFWCQIFLVFNLFLMAGCAATSHRMDEQPVILLDAHALQSATLYEKQVYRVLLAETAYQRGQLQWAAEEYLSVALENREPVLVMRACYMILSANSEKIGLQRAQHWMKYCGSIIKNAPEDKVLLGVFERFLAR